VSDGDGDGDLEDLSTIPPGPLERLVYLPDRAPGRATLRLPAAAGGGGVALAWDAETFPHVWLWRQLGGRGFPFHGRARLVCIEPQSAWPYGAEERLRLAPGEGRETWLTAELLDAPGS
jgi:hypothetical protein